MRQDYYKQRPNPDCDPQGPDKGEARCRARRLLGQWSRGALRVAHPRRGTCPGARGSATSGFVCAR